MEDESLGHSEGASGKMGLAEEEDPRLYARHLVWTLWPQFPHCAMGTERELAVISCCEEQQNPWEENDEDLRA